MTNVVKAMLAADELPTGVLLVTPGAEQVQTLAAAGFNFVIIDQMYGAISWADCGEIARTARLVEMTPIVRLPSEPWALQSNKDHLVINAARALSVGCQGLLFDANGPDEVEAVVETALGPGGWHREMQVIPWTVDTFDDVVAGYREETLIGVGIESGAGLENIESIIDIKGVDFISVSQTDLTLALGDGVDSESESIKRVFADVKKACEARGVSICTNTGMAFGQLDAMRARAASVIDAGADMVVFQTSSLLLQWAGHYVLEDVERRRKEQKEAP